MKELNGEEYTILERVIKDVTDTFLERVELGHYMTREDALDDFTIKVVETLLDLRIIRGPQLELKQFPFGGES